VAALWIYILRCSDGTFYTGSTSDLNKRIEEHQRGVYCGYTSNRLPVALAFSQELPDEFAAMQAERQIKSWSHGKKEALIRGDFLLLHELAQCRNETHFANLHHSPDKGE
jgi:putative endonuclease